MATDFNCLRNELVIEVIQADTLGHYSENFLKQLPEKFQSILDSENISLGKVARKYITALKRFIQCKYIAGFQLKTLQEISIEQNVTLNEDEFNKYFWELVVKPLHSMLADAGHNSVNELVKLLSGVIHAINEKTLREQVGECDEKTFRFILDAFALDEVLYHFQSFRDPQLETLYSNDGINLLSAYNKRYVSQFFWFFIDGDAQIGEDYNTDRYYGCIPVAESRILSYCQSIDIPKDISSKLMSIVKCSNRFDCSFDEHGEIQYSLKIQYLNNKYAMSVSILFAEGRPLHKEELHRRIQSLHVQYPNLVEEHSLQSFVLRGSTRAKPILCSASTQGEWKLQIWAKQRDVFQDLRDYVTEMFNATSQPVPFDLIKQKMSSLGHSYPPKTLMTYITKSGCVSKRGGLYAPPGATGDNRFWYGKLYLLQRLVAECLLVSGRKSVRSTIIDYIQQKSGHSVNLLTLDRAIKERPDLFSITPVRRNQQIVLSDLISSKRDVNRVISEPEKKEPDYVKNVRFKLIDYLFEHTEELQKTLKEIFIKDIPEHLKARETIIGSILSDKEIFQKQGSPCKVSLQPAYRARLEMERPSVVEDMILQRATTSFSWDALKTGIMKELLKDSLDNELSRALDNVFYIFHCGETEMPLNSIFGRVVNPLFKYVTSETSIEEHRDLQEKILMIMEAFFKEFYLLKYGYSLQDQNGFGEVRYFFQKLGLLPDKDRSYLSPEDLTIARTVEMLNKQRNKVVGHPTALAEQSDRQSVSDIHNCLVIMAYLGRKF